MTVGGAITGTDNFFAHMRIYFQHLLSVKHFQFQSHFFLILNGLAHASEFFFRRTEPEVSFPHIFHVHAQFFMQLTVYLNTFHGQRHLLEISG